MPMPDGPFDAWSSIREAVTSDISADEMKAIDERCAKHGPTDEDFVEWARQAHMDRVRLKAEVSRLEFLLTVASPAYVYSGGRK